MGRFSGRKPQSYSYATLAPVLHYNATQQDFYGGNFWDMRATGSRLQSASAEQIEAAVSEAITETGATSMKDMGKVMKAVQAKLAGQNADGRAVSEIVKTELSG